jgi:hypothetical protein
VEARAAASTAAGLSAVRPAGSMGEVWAAHPVGVKEGVKVG